MEGSTGCLTCEELVGHLRVHLGRNDTNYFMYWWAWPWKQSYSSHPWLFKLIHLIHSIKIKRET